MSAIIGNLNHKSGIINPQLAGTQGVSTGMSNTWFTSSWDVINNTYLKWVLPFAGEYLLFCVLRVNFQNSGGLMHIELYNYTTSATVPDTLRLLKEAQQSGHNDCATPCWRIDVTQPSTIQIKGRSQYATPDGDNRGIQSDGSGKNECFWRYLGK